MSQPLPYDEMKFDKIDELEDIQTTPVATNIDYLVEVDIKHSDEIKEKRKFFPFCPEISIMI